MAGDENGDRIGNDASSPGVYGDGTGDNENCVLCGVANVFFSGDGDKFDSRSTLSTAARRTLMSCTDSFNDFTDISR